MAFDMKDYKEVPERIADFKAKHPEASLQPADLAAPFQVVTIGEQTFVAYAAAAYRTPDDQRPGIGLAWEPFPGKTSYTRDSELQNAETSAWGRAIVAAMASESKHVASAQDVRNRGDDAPPPRQQSAGPPVCDVCKEPALKDITKRGAGYVHKACIVSEPGEVQPF